MTLCGTDNLAVAAQAAYSAAALEDKLAAIPCYSSKDTNSLVLSMRFAFRFRTARNEEDAPDGAQGDEEAGSSQEVPVAVGARASYASCAASDVRRHCRTSALIEDRFGGALLRENGSLLER